jgi:8-oxo-dGTP pyrophosphatase MutT (NUDIX family)
MLLFYAPPSALDLDAAARRGLTAPDGAALRLHMTLEAAERAAAGPVLVVDAAALGRSPPFEGDVVPVASVPGAALQNLSPYRAPTPVAAAGGYVACLLPDDVAVLLIRRRGVWDLPKGHRDPGEALDACAAREVREEVGIDRLQVRRPLGTTVHGYPDGDTYAVKTTHWFLMRTPERTFEPERDEGIRRVAPARWAVARRHIGYDTLRRHMDAVEADVHGALSSG